jgi:hypothetical protein
MLSKPSVLDLNHPPSSFGSRNVTTRRKEGDNLARECLQRLAILAEAMQAPGSQFSKYQQLKARGDSASANRTALAGVREEQYLGRKSLLDVLIAERELVEAGVKLIEARRDLVQASYATLASMGRLKTVTLKAVTTRLTGRRSAQYCKKSRAILAHSDDTGSRQLGSERTLSLERYHSIVKF